MKYFFVILCILCSTLSWSNSLSKLKEEKSPELLFSTNNATADNLLEKGEFFWQLGVLNKAYEKYTQLLEKDPLLSVMTDNKRYMITQRYYQYESNHNINHALTEHDPRLTDKPLSEDDIKNIQSNVNFETIHTTNTETVKVEEKKAVSIKDKKKKKQVKSEPRIKKDIVDNMYVVLFIIGGFIFAISISALYWYQQNKEKEELIHSKHEEYLQGSIKKYEEILDYISILESRRNINKKDPNFNDFACQASIKSLTDLNNELFSLITSAKKTKSKDKDIDKFVAPIYKKAKELFTTAPDSKRIKF